MSDGSSTPSLFTRPFVTIYYLNWIWTPFAEDAKPDLGIVAGRIAHFLALGKDDIVPAPLPQVDQRIALPILAIIFKNEGKNVQIQLTDDIKDDIKNDLVGYEALWSDKSKKIIEINDIPFWKEPFPSSLLDVCTLAMSNCVSGLLKSLDPNTRLEIFRSWMVFGWASAR